MLTKRELKRPDYEAPVPEEQALIYQVCGVCRQEMPLDQFRVTGGITDSVCDGCRTIQEKETKKYVRRNAKKIDEMQLRLLERLADEPMDNFDDVPDIGTALQYGLRTFGGIQGISLQIASSYLSSAPGSACRQRTHSMLMGMVKEASKLGYAKKPIELLSDDELEEFMRERERRLINGLSDGEEASEKESTADNADS